MQNNCPLFYSIILLIIAIILKESTHYSTTHSNYYAAELQRIFLFCDKSDEMGLLKRSSREHGPEESREVCSLEELLFLSLLYSATISGHRAGSPGCVWTSSHCITYNSPRVPRMIVLIIAHHHAHHYRYLTSIIGTSLLVEDPISNIYSTLSRD